MKYLNQFAFILSIYFVGIVINKFLVSFLPATVIGMLLLFILFLLKIISIGSLKEFSDFMLMNLAFFFIPSGVSLIKIWPVLSGNILKILFIVVITTIITMIVTGLSVDFLIKRGERNDKPSK